MAPVPVVLMDEPTRYFVKRSIKEHLSFFLSFFLLFSFFLNEKYAHFSYACSYE